MDDIGYLVIEAPREWRMKSCWHSRFGLENVRAAIVNALAGRRMGGRGRSRRHGVFDRCLNMRLHYFGDKNPGKWNPHFNLLVDSVSQEFRDKLSHEIDEHDIKMRRLVKVGARKEVKYAIAQLGMIAVWRRGGMALPAPALQAMKTAIRSAVGIDNLIINYSHSDEPGRKFHWISYIERSTFRKLDWDEYMAAQLCGFRNARRWGKWDSPAVWSLNDLQGEDKAKAESLVKVATLAEGTCPDCHAPLESRINADGQLVFWSTPVLSDYLAVWPHEDIGAEFYRIPSRECPDHVLKNNDMDFRKRRAIVRGRYVEYVGERTRTMVALKYLVGSRRDVSCEAEYNLAMLQLVTDAAGRKEISCQLALLPEFDPVNVFRGSMIKAFCQDNLDDG